MDKGNSKINKINNNEGHRHKIKTIFARVFLIVARPCLTSVFSYEQGGGA
jgi:hypothetical protein